MRGAITSLLTIVRSMASAVVDSASGGAIMNQLDNYIIVDIGANLTNKKFARDLDSVIKRAKEAGKLYCASLAVSCTRSCALAT